MTSDVEHLILDYAEWIDGGDLEAVAGLFAHATYRTAGSPHVLQGADQVLAAQRAVMKLYDGSPRTHHTITNIGVTVDPGGRQARARSYYAVIFAGPGEDPRIILTGRYEDTFEHVDETWRFVDRLIHVDQVGDLSGHLKLELLGDSPFDRL